MERSSIVIDKRLQLIPFFLFSTSLAFSYIDPGTGSLLVNVILGVLLTLIFSLKGFVYDLIAKIRGNGNSLKLDYPGKLVIFNEGKNYWNVFKPIILNLLTKNIDFVYLTADSDDPGLEFCLEQNLESRYLGNMREALFSLGKLSAKTLLSTTPQLGIISFKKSEKVDHYCNILHAPIDIHVYKKFAFDDFDSIMCTSSFQIDNLRFLEKVRHTSPKKLFETGCTYYDNKEVKESAVDGDSILFAPTWGDKSFLAKSGIKLLDLILKGSNPVIFRPHPQSWISEPELLDEIIKKYSSHSNFKVDKETSNTEAINKSKIIICDISGIIYDFILLENKPVIAVKHKWKDGGYESSDIENRQSAELLLETKGEVITESDYVNILNIIDDILKEDCNTLNIDEHIFNFKKAGSIAASQLIELQNRR